MNIQQCAVQAMCCVVRGRVRDVQAPYIIFLGDRQILTGNIRAEHGNLGAAIQFPASSPNFSGNPTIIYEPSAILL